MSDEGPKSISVADDAIAEALKSVERLETESAGDGAESEAEGGSDGEINLDEVELVGPGPREDDDAGDGELAFVEDEAAPQPAKPKKPSAQDAIMQSMIDAKNEALEVLDQTQKEAKSLRERLLRVSADFENYKKRQAREKQDAIKFANESLLKELLPVVDNFDRALAGAKGTEGDADKALSTIVQGVEMVNKQFTDALKHFGVEGFDSVGVKFDPALHEAVSTKEDPSVPNQTVLEEYQRGYKLQGRLVRPSMVIVSSGGPPAGAKGANGEAKTEAGES